MQIEKYEYLHELISLFCEKEENKKHYEEFKKLLTTNVGTNEDKDTDTFEDQQKVLTLRSKKEIIAAKNLLSMYVIENAMSLSLSGNIEILQYAISVLNWALNIDTAQTKNLDKMFNSIINYHLHLAQHMLGEPCNEEEIKPS